MRRTTVKIGRNSRRALLLTVSILLIMLAVGGTYALLHAADGALVNEFHYGQVPITPEETFRDDLKKDVSFTNTGSTDAYIRAAVVCTWKDTAGNVSPTAPVEDVDYIISFNTAKWQKGEDGYWYCKTPVAPQKKTPVLISECKKTNYGTGDALTPNQPEKFDLSVEILAQSVQANPADAMKELWNMKVNADGSFSPAA